MNKTAAMLLFVCVVILGAALVVLNVTDSPKTPEFVFNGDKTQSAGHSSSGSEPRPPLSTSTSTAETETTGTPVRSTANKAAETTVDTNRDLTGDTAVNPAVDPDRSTATGNTGAALVHELCLLGCPASHTQPDQLITRPIYLLKFNAQTKFADWVAYRVSRFTIGKSKERVWRADPELKPEWRITPGDYRNAYRALGTDRGHQVPLASFSGTEYWHFTNYLSNITPQRSQLNRGPWKKLEARVRKLARQSHVEYVYVMTGPLYLREMPSLPASEKKHKIPSAYWKIVSIRYQSKILTAGFVMDQDSGQADDFCQKTTTVRDIEKQSQLNFFHVLSQPEQDKLETLPGTLLSMLGCTVTAKN